MVESMSWNVPVSEHLMDSFQTIYSKKIEYAEGKSAYFTVAHSWVTGEWAITGPKWKRRDFRSGAHANYTKEQTETLEYYHQHGRERYIGDTVSREVNCFYQTDREFNCLRKVPLSQYLERICIEEYQGAILFRFFKFRCHMPDVGETGGYSEFKRIYIEDGKAWTEYPTNEHRYYWEEKHYKSALTQLMYMNRANIAFQANNIVSLLRKNFPEYFIPEHHCDWFKFFPTNEQNNRFQKKVNELNSLVSKDIPSEVFDIPSPNAVSEDLPFEDISSSVVYKHFCYERLSDSSFVVRMFVKTKENLLEYGRFFADENDLYPCYYCNGAVSRCDNIDSDFWTSDNKIKLDIKGTVLNQRMPYIKKQNSEKVVYGILMSRKYLVLEQLEKMGYGKFVKNCLQGTNGKRELYAMFVECGLSFKKDTKKNGVNAFFTKPELKRLSLFKSYIKDCGDISVMKRLFTQCGLSGIDILQKIANTINTNLMNNHLNQYVTILSRIAVRIEDSKKMNILADKIWKQYLDIEKNYRNEYYAWYNLRDSYSMCDNSYVEDDEYYRQLCLLSNIRTPDGIKEAHDKLMCLAKFKQYPAERFDKICKKHKKWEYSDDNFDIRLPSGTDEIIMEGSRMNHCVGTYVDSFMQGSTIIMFLRKKSNPDKEYVTIEMNRDGSLYQVKCKNNYMVSSKSTLEFLTKWIEDKKLNVKTRDVVWNKDKLSPCTNPYTGYFMEDDSIIVKKHKIA